MKLSHSFRSILSVALLTAPLIAQAQENTGAAASSTPPLNPNAIALLRWYPVNKTAQIVVPGPIAAGAIVFDGANLWVTGIFENTITKVRASDGATLGAFAVGAYPNSAAFDGASI
jgi:hypothetical protein